MGYAIAERLSNEGLTVHALARNAAGLDGLTDRTGCIPHVADITDTAALAAVVAELEIDVLVNNAGCRGPATSLTPRLLTSTNRSM